MLLFCPYCSNMLTISRHPHTENPEDEELVGKNRFECRSCPYQFVLKKRYYDRKPMERKEVEDVMGGEGAWENVDRTEVEHCTRKNKPTQCPNDKCDGSEAYFYQVQIRSADEPMTSFFKCCKCGRRWNE